MPYLRNRLYFHFRINTYVKYTYQKSLNGPLYLSLS